jgi:hypothetical protein
MKLTHVALALSLIAAFPACGSDHHDSTPRGSSEADGGSGKGGEDGSGGSSGGSGGSSDAGQGGARFDAGTGGAPSGVGQSTSKRISAADGGKVVLGDAALSIPGGALAGDTTVTVSTSMPGKDLPDGTSLHGLVYDFGPDGTQFSEPATLTLPSAGQPGADEEAVIAWLDVSKGAWQDLATTVNADGSLSAEVKHFTNYVVRFNGVVSTDCGFSACGGNLVGTWKVTSVCAEIAGAVIDVCPTAVAQLDLTLTGTATFSGDGTRSSDFTTKATITYTLDAACLNAITSGKPPATCDVLSKPADPANGDGPTACTGDPTVSCTCVEDNPEKSEKKTGTYTADGSTLTMTEDADGSMKTAEFCVKGSEVRVKQPEDLAVLTWIATKQ